MAPTLDVLVLFNMRRDTILQLRKIAEGKNTLETRKPFLPYLGTSKNPNFEQFFLGKNGL